LNSFKRYLTIKIRYGRGWGKYDALNWLQGQTPYREDMAKNGMAISPDRGRKHRYLTYIGDLGEGVWVVNALLGKGRFEGIGTDTSRDGRIFYGSIFKDGQWRKRSNPEKQARALARMTKTKEDYAYSYAPYLLEQKLGYIPQTTRHLALGLGERERIQRAWAVMMKNKGFVSENLKRSALEFKTITNASILEMAENRPTHRELTEEDFLKFPEFMYRLSEEEYSKFNYMDDRYEAFVKTLTP
jgi:hypothetical protein